VLFGRPKFIFSDKILPNFNFSKKISAKFPKFCRFRLLNHLPVPTEMGKIRMKFDFFGCIFSHRFSFHRRHLLLQACRAQSMPYMPSFFRSRFAALFATKHNSSSRQRRAAAMWIGMRKFCMSHYGAPQMEPFSFILSSRQAYLVRVVSTLLGMRPHYTKTINFENLFEI
jgi:hypothetical protein